MRAHTALRFEGDRRLETYQRGIVTKTTKNDKYLALPSVAVGNKKPRTQLGGLWQANKKKEKRGRVMESENEALERVFGGKRSFFLCGGSVPFHLVFLI